MAVPGLPPAAAAEPERGSVTAAAHWLKAKSLEVTVTSRRLTSRVVKFAESQPAPGPGQPGARRSRACSDPEAGTTLHSLARHRRLPVSAAPAPPPLPAAPWQPLARAATAAADGVTAAANLDPAPSESETVTRDSPDAGARPPRRMIMMIMT